MESPEDLGVAAPAPRNDFPIPSRRQSTLPPIKHRRLTRDQRRDVQLMRSLGYKQDAIATHLSITVAAVRYAINAPDTTPGHHKAGRAAKMTPEQVRTLIHFVRTHDTHTLSYKQLAEQLFPGTEIGHEQVKYAVRKNNLTIREPVRKFPKDKPADAETLEQVKEKEKEP